MKDIPECGVFVDVFPMDGLSDSYAKAKAIMKQNGRRMRINAAIIRKKVENKGKAILYKICQILFTSKRLCRKIENSSVKYSFGHSQYVGVTCGFYGEREIMKKEIFSDVAKVEFEGRTFCAPIKYDQYLKNMYGDYMQLPPVKKRVTHHSFVAYWKEKT